MRTSSEGATKDMTERNKELVLRFYTATDHGTQRDLLSPDLVGRSPGVPDFGRDGFLRGVAELFEAFPDGTYTNDEIVAEGDKVVTVGRFRGTHRKPFHGMPPTGEPVTFVAVHVDRVVDGRIVEHLRISAPDGSRPGSRPDPTASTKVSP